jgi:large-conductance mechanosensitive channel
VIIVGLCFGKILDTTVERIFLPIFSIDLRQKDLTLALQNL